MRRATRLPLYDHGTNEPETGSWTIRHSGWLCQNFVSCAEVLRPSQPNGVMSSAVSLPSHTFSGQAVIHCCAHSFASPGTKNCPSISYFLIISTKERCRTRNLLINSRTRIQLSHRGRHCCHIRSLKTHQLCYRLRKSTAKLLQCSRASDNSIVNLGMTTQRAHNVEF